MANKAASDLAKVRWNKTGDAERKEVGRALNEARTESLSPERRSDIAKRAAMARWGKKAAGKKATRKADSK